MEVKRAAFFSLGTILFSLGVIGAVIPILPTTPFVLVSFFCFGKSSKRAERWISNNRYFGSYIENYKTKKGVPLDVKLKSIAFLWLTLTLSLLFFFDQTYILMLLTFVGTVVTAHILLLKTRI